MRGDVTLSQFEMRFMRIWRETRERGERNPKAVEDLFHYVQNYVADADRLRPGSSDVDDQQLHAALRRADSSLAPKGAFDLMRSWFAVLPLYIVLVSLASAQEIAPAPAPTPQVAPPAPNPIAMLEECVRARTQILETSREAADMVAVAAIQKCNRELTAATTSGGQPRSLAEARQQLKDAMREIAITEVVDIRTARFMPPPPPPPKAEEPKPAAPVAKKPARRRTAAPKPAVKPAPVAAPQP
jgi:hypothetical protein